MGLLPLLLPGRAVTLCCHHMGPFGLRVSGSLLRNAQRTWTALPEIVSNMQPLLLGVQVANPQEAF